MKHYLVLLFIIVYAVIRIFIFETTPLPPLPDYWHGSIALEGVVIEDPDLGIEKTKLVIRPLATPHFSDGRDWNVLVTLPSGMIVHYGDRVRIYGKIQAPEAFTTETGRVFDYKRFLASKRIIATMTAADLTVISQRNGSIILEKLFSIKRLLVTRAKQLFPADEAGLLAGIVLGEKSLLPKHVLDNFKTVGLTHMVVLSGSNITLIAMICMYAISQIGFGYYGKRIGALMMISLFILMTGLDASSVRAGIMAVILIVTQLTFRTAAHLRVIIITAGIMIIINPAIARSDPAFHLSFLAFIGLTFLVPAIRNYLNEKYSSGKLHIFLDSFIGSIIFETAAVQVMVLPYIVWMQGTFSLLLLLANVVTVPFIPIIMGLGAVSIIGSFTVPVVGSWSAEIAAQFLRSILFIADYGAHVPNTIVTFPMFSFWIVIGGYGILIMVISKYYS